MNKVKNTEKSSKANLSLWMSQSLDESVKSFSKNNFISKAKIFEIALREYLERHKDGFA